MTPLSSGDPPIIIWEPLLYPTGLGTACGSHGSMLTCLPHESSGTVWRWGKRTAALFCHRVQRAQKCHPSTRQCCRRCHISPGVLRPTSRCSRLCSAQPWFWAVIGHRTGAICCSLDWEQTMGYCCIYENTLKALYSMSWVDLKRCHSIRFEQIYVQVYSFSSSYVINTYSK